MRSSLAFTLIFSAVLAAAAGYLRWIEQGSAFNAKTLESFIVKDRQFTKPEQVIISEFGWNLFRNKAFSSNAQVSCESCHPESQGFMDAKRVSEGVGKTKLNAPALINLDFKKWFFWDGRVDSLIAQALEPIENSVEHGFSRLGLVHMITRDYRQAYEEAFGSYPEILIDYFNDFSVIQHGYPRKIIPSATLGPSEEILPAQNEEWIRNYEQLSKEERAAVEEVFVNFGRAIAWYQKGLIAIDSPFDRFLRSQNLNDNHYKPNFVEGFGPKEFAGLKLFVGKARCVQCHSGKMFSDEGFHFTALADTKNIGRLAGMEFYQKSQYRCLDESPCRKLENKPTEEHRYQQKTPSLRNVAMTAPYLHDGSVASLKELLELYNTPPENQNRDPLVQNLELNSDELEQLEAFLHSLTSKIRDLGQEWIGY